MGSTRETQLKKMREVLHRRRRDILLAHHGATRELTALHDQERDPEYEEAAQSELADFTLSSLMETQRIELRGIDAALARIDAGTYGECIDCGEFISIERLGAMPFALRCAADETQHERDTGYVAVSSL